MLIAVEDIEANENSLREDNSNKNSSRNEVSTLLDQIDSVSDGTDCINDESCSSSLRFIASIYAGQIVWYTGSLAAFRLLNAYRWPPEAQLALILACAVPGALSNLLLWWSSGQIENCIKTRPYWEKLDNLAPKPADNTTSKWIDYFSLFKFLKPSMEETSLTNNAINMHDYGTKNEVGK